MLSLSLQLFNQANWPSYTHHLFNFTGSCGLKWIPNDRFLTCFSCNFILLPGFLQEICGESRRRHIFVNFMEWNGIEWVHVAPCTVSCKLQVIQTYIRNWSLQPLNQGYGPSFSHHLSCVR